MEVEGKPRTPQWKSIPETPACDSTCEIVSPSEIKFTWYAFVHLLLSNLRWPLHSMPIANIPFHCHCVVTIEF